MKFIFAPTVCHSLRYCSQNDLNPKEFMLLDLNNPWYILEQRLEQRDFEGDNKVIILDNDYTHNPELFQTIMGYLEEVDDIKMEIVEGVYFS